MAKQKMRGKASFVSARSCIISRASRVAGKSVAPGVKKIVDRLACSGWLSDWPERLACELRRASPRGLARWNRDHRRDGRFSGEPSDEQISADAVVTTRRGPPASGSLRRLQWHARFRLRIEVLPSERRIPANRGCRLTPNFAAVPRLARQHLHNVLEWRRGERRRDPPSHRPARSPPPNVGGRLAPRRL